MNVDDESLVSESIDLPDDVLILLAKDYIRERDGLSLSLSGDIIMREIISGQLVYRIATNATNATNARTKNIFNDLVVVN